MTELLATRATPKKLPFRVYDRSSNVHIFAILLSDSSTIRRWSAAVKRLKKKTETTKEQSETRRTKGVWIGLDSIVEEKKTREREREILYRIPLSPVLECRKQEWWKIEKKEW